MKPDALSPLTVIRRLRNELEHCLTLLDRQRSDERQQGQREAIRHVLTVLDNLQGVPVKKQYEAKRRRG